MARLQPRPKSVAETMRQGLVQAGAPLDAVSALLAFARRYDLALAADAVEAVLVTAPSTGVVYQPAATLRGFLACCSRTGLYLPRDVSVSGQGLGMRATAVCQTRHSCCDAQWVEVSVCVSYGSSYERDGNARPAPAWLDDPIGMLEQTAMVRCAQKALGEPWSTMPIAGVVDVVPAQQHRSCMRDLRVADRRFHQVLN